jgi:inosine/xanthosine triphosphatase
VISPQHPEAGPEPEALAASIALASHNPVKIQAVLGGFGQMFPGLAFQVLPVKAASGVSDQPVTDQETLLGAHNRAHAARLATPGADYWVGIEGGIQDLGEEMAAFAWVVVLSSYGEGKARSGTFFLPPAIAELVRTGMELGEADDVVFQQTNTKQANGAIGLLTRDIITRTQLYEHAVVLSLVSFKNPGYYFSNAGNA